MSEVSPWLLVFFGSPCRGTEGMKRSEMVAAVLSSRNVLMSEDEFFRD
jgi:hypothetical protein